MQFPALRQLIGLPTAVAPDYAITPERVACLASMIGNPTRYTQRFVEQLSFASTGGQRWQRSLQIEIPSHPSTPPDRGWWIVSLGPFERRRLADLVVQDAFGQRINLLKRRQHGHALTDAITINYVLPPHSKPKITDDATALASDFRRRLFSFFTTHGGPSETDASLVGKLLALEQVYSKLIDNLPLTHGEKDTRRTSFIKYLEPWIDQTQYLCWVKATPGEVINLQATYTASDPNHELDIGTFKEAAKSLRVGLRPSKRDDPRTQRAKWYRQYGLAPIDYEFEASSEVGSYYLIIEPPPYSSLTYLDWEDGCHFHQTHRPGEAREVTCAYPAAHIHADEGQMPVPVPADKEGVTIRAYLRCTPYRHKQILGAAALNIAVVWLLGKGKLPPGLGEPLQGLIVAAPSVLIAFLTQQGRHYYSHVMRRQRAILWAYLTVSVAFLVAVAFSERDGSLGLGWFAADVARVLAVFSGGVIGWHLLLGSSYERAVKFLAGQKRKRAEKKGNDTDRSMWKYYGAATRKYSALICVFTFVLAAASGIALGFWWGNVSARSGNLASHRAKPAVSIQVNGVNIHTPQAPSPPETAPYVNQPQSGR